MEKEKGFCCGLLCIGNKRKKKAVMVESFAQTEGVVMVTRAVVDRKIRPQSDNYSYPRTVSQDFHDAKGEPRIKTSIVTGNNLSSTVLNDSKDASVHTPVMHNYEQSEIISNNVPQVFDNIKLKISSNGLPMLTPITPARSFKKKSVTSRYMCKHSVNYSESNIIN